MLKPQAVPEARARHIGDFDKLDNVYKTIVDMLYEGVTNRKVPFHTVNVSTVKLDGTPTVRTVVLRDFDESRRTIRFHSDLRSAKIDEIQQQSRVCLHFYDPKRKTQLRIYGTATVHTDDQAAQDVWDETRLFSRRCYLQMESPGSTSDTPTSGLPDDLGTNNPDYARSEEGRQNFSIVVVHFDEIDWLYLAAAGHRRARFKWAQDASDQVGQWVYP